MQIADPSSYFSNQSFNPFPIPQPLTPQERLQARIQLSQYVSNEKRGKRMKRCGMICVKQMFKVPHLLVVRGASSHIWSLPKGCINDGETETQCATRECYEETGLKLSLDDTHQRININHNVYFIVPLEQHAKFKIHDRAEVDKVCWMTLQELKQVDCNKDLRSILQYPQKKFLFHTTLHDILGLQSLLNPTPTVKPFLTSSQSFKQAYKQAYTQLYKQSFRPYKLFQTPLFRELVGKPVEVL